MCCPLFCLSSPPPFQISIGHRSPPHTYEREREPRAEHSRAQAPPAPPPANIAPTPPAPRQREKSRFDRPAVPSANVNVASNVNLNPTSSPLRSRGHDVYVPDDINTVAPQRKERERDREHDRRDVELTSSTQIDDPSTSSTRPWPIDEDRYRLHAPHDRSMRRSEATGPDAAILVRVRSSSISSPPSDHQSQARMYFL